MEEIKLDLSVEELQKVAKQNGANFVFASFKSLGKIPRVLVKFPKAGDRYLKRVPEHKIMVLNHENLHEALLMEIPENFNKGEYIDKTFVSRTFFLDEVTYGEWVIVDVEVIIKHDYFRNKKTVALNIFPSKNPDPLYKLKLGTPKQFPISFEIPGTKKYIGFEEI